MIRIQLDDLARAGLHSLRRSDLTAQVRDRIEMVSLSDAGWSPPRIAAHLGYHPQTVRNLLRGFAAWGRDALFPGTPGPAPDAERRRQVTDALQELLQQERTWTSRQLGEALRERGIALGPRQVRRYLGLLDAGYRRTASTLEHKRDPAKVERAKRVLANLKKSGVGPPDALLPRRMRLRPHPADRLQLVPAGPAQAGQV